MNALSAETHSKLHCLLSQSLLFIDQGCHIWNIPLFCSNLAIWCFCIPLTSTAASDLLYSLMLIPIQRAVVLEVVIVCYNRSYTIGCNGKRHSKKALAGNTYSVKKNFTRTFTEKDIQQKWVVQTMVSSVQIRFALILK